MGLKMLNEENYRDVLNFWNVSELLTVILQHTAFIFSCGFTK